MGRVGIREVPGCPVTAHGSQISPSRRGQGRAVVNGVGMSRHRIPGDLHSVHRERRRPGRKNLLRSADGKGRMSGGGGLVTDDPLIISRRSRGGVHTQLQQPRLVARRRTLGGGGPIGGGSHGVGGKDKPMKTGLGSRGARGRGQGVVGQSLEFLDVGQPPIAVSTQHQILRVGDGSTPGRGGGWNLLPHQTGIQVRHGTVAVVAVVVPVGRLAPADVAGMVTVGSPCTKRFVFGLWPQSRALVGTPHQGGIGSVDVRRPPIFRHPRGIVGKVQRVHRRVGFVVKDAEKLRGRGKTPVRVSARVHGGGIAHRRFPGTLPVVGFLPHQPGHAVGHGSIAVVIEGRGINGVIRILPEGQAHCVGLPGIRQLQQAGSSHGIGGQAVVDVAVVGGGGENRAGQLTAGIGPLRSPGDGNRLGIGTPVDPPAAVVISSPQGVPHQVLVRRRNPCQILKKIPCDIGLQGHRILEGCDDRPRHGFGVVAAGSAGPDRTHFRLSVDLAAEIDHGPVDCIHEVRALRSRRGAPDGVIMVRAGDVGVAPVRIEGLLGRAVGLGIAVDGIPVQGPSDRLVRAHDGLKMKRGDVVMIIVRQATVTPILIQLTDRVGILPAIVAWVEDGDPVHGQGHGASLKIIGRERNRGGGRHRHQRKFPDIHLVVA